MLHHGQVIDLDGIGHCIDPAALKPDESAGGNGGGLKVKGRIGAGHTDKEPCGRSGGRQEMSKQEGSQKISANASNGSRGSNGLFLHNSTY